MEIESSKLKWYYDKPKFEDVKGKPILIEIKTDYQYLGKIHSIDFCNETFYNDWFVLLYRYAIIDTSEEPLPLDGVMPKLNQDGRWVVYWNFWRMDEQTASYYFYGKTREQAIANWNAFVRRLK